MGNVIPIIITGGGCPGIAGTIEALQNNPDGTQFRIITTDIEPDVVGKYLSDTFYQVPAPEDYDVYLQAMYEIAKKEQAQAILPLTTRELMPLSYIWETGFAEMFSEINCKVIISGHGAIKTANDKYRLLRKAHDNMIPCPEYYLAESIGLFCDLVEILGYPENKVIIKPNVSNGMRGLRILTDESWDAMRFKREKPDGTEISLENIVTILSNGIFPKMMVMEYLSGPEYTVDVFRGANGTIAIPRLRERIRSGITFDCKIDLRYDLIEYSKCLSVLLNLKYCHGYQFKLDEDGNPKLLECNPRIQGTMAASIGAGFNMIYASVMEALGKPADISSVKLTDGAQFKRYWGGIITDGK